MMKLKKIASHRSRTLLFLTFIASLVLSILQSVVVLAFSIPYSYSGGKHHCSAFTSSQQHAHYHRFRSSALQSAASDDKSGVFFSDDSGGNFFEEAEKPLSREKEEEAPMTLEELEMMATPFDEHLPKINAVTLVGRVGNDPEPRYFDDGKVVLNLSLAVRRKYHPLERKVRNIRSGDEETDWFSLEFWGRDAEYVMNYVEKGTRLGITGSLTMDGWADKMTGEQRRKPKIIVRHTDILESRAEAELRKGNRGNYGNSGGKKYDDDEEDGGPSPAGTGGFFS